MNPLSHAKNAIKERPAKITAKEFLEMVGENPSIFEHWDTPLEIREFVDCSNSPITHLSNLLTFSGKNENGYVAKFKACQSLKIATGTFKGGVWFSNSGIEKIENLQITQPDKQGWAATFADCKNLQIATGNYVGTVIFSGSGVHSIQNLHIQNLRPTEEYADFSKCPNLQNLKGWDISKKILIEPKKIQAEKERRALLKHQKETTPQELPFL
jgi:hypothetical protein